jgi:tetratricopeptide (TPR) repeat protein
MIGRARSTSPAVRAVEHERAVLGQGAFLAASPRSLVAHYAKGNILRQMGRYEAAISEYEAVIELDRNAPCAYANLAWCAR